MAVQELAYTYRVKLFVFVMLIEGTERVTRPQFSMFSGKILDVTPRQRLKTVKNCAAVQNEMANLAIFSNAGCPIQI